MTDATLPAAVPLRLPPRSAYAAPSSKSSKSTQRLKSSLTYYPIRPFAPLHVCMKDLTADIFHAPALGERVSKGKIFVLGDCFLRGQRGQTEESRIHAGLLGFGCGGIAVAKRGQCGGKQIHIREREIIHSFIYRPFSLRRFPCARPCLHPCAPIRSWARKGFPLAPLPPQPGVLGCAVACWRTRCKGCGRGRAGALWWAWRPAERARPVLGGGRVPGGRCGVRMGLLAGAGRVG